MDAVQIDAIDIQLIEFKTSSGTIDINPVQVVYVLNDKKDYHLEKERNSCVIGLLNGINQVVSEPRSEVVRKLMRLK